MPESGKRDPGWGTPVTSAEGSDQPERFEQGTTPEAGPEQEDAGRQISDFNLIWFIATTANRAKLPMHRQMHRSINLIIYASLADFDVYQMFWRMYEDQDLSEEEILLGRLSEG